MYCPSCGMEATVGLRYCTRCGANLIAGQQPQPARSVGVAWALALSITAITLIGLGIIFATTYELVQPVAPGFTPAADREVVALVMIAFGTTLLLGADVMLIKIFSRLMGLSAPKPEKVVTPRPAINEYPPPQLSSPPASLSSVTEHTTRNFEPRQYGERKTGE